MTRYYRKKLKQYAEQAFEFNEKIVHGVYVFNDLIPRVKTEQELISLYEEFLATSYDPKEENVVIEELAMIVNELIEDARQQERIYNKKKQVREENKIAKLN